MLNFSGLHMKTFGIRTWLVMVLATLLTGCLTPEQAAQWEANAAMERQRRANLTPKQRCQEDVNERHRSCGINCSLGNFGNANATRMCDSSCERDRLVAFQTCSML